MVQSFCFVPGCSTGYPSDRKRCKTEGVKLKSMFTAPEDPETFEKWKKAVARADRELSHDSRVCELHFLEEDVEKYYTTTMPDGSVNKIERGKALLKNGSVPCIFPNLPNYLSKTNKRRKLPADRNSGAENKQSDAVPNSRRELTSSNCELRLNKGNIVKCYGKKHPGETIQDMNQQIFSIKEEPVSDSEVQEIGVKEKNDANIQIQSSYSVIQETNSDFEIQEVKEESDVNNEIQSLFTIEKIEVPNEWWAVNSTPKFIVCVKWDASYVCERKVIIEDNLNVKLFIKDHEILEEEDLKLSSIEEASYLLWKIDKYSICPGIDMFKEHCLKYRKEVSLRHSPWCINCRKERSLLLSRIQRNSQMLLSREQRREAKLKEYKRKFANVTRQNKRLKKKVERLRNKVKFLTHKDMTFFTDSKKKCMDVTSDIDDIENENMESDDDGENFSNMESDIDDDENISYMESDIDGVENISNIESDIDDVENPISTSEMVANVTSDRDKFNATKPTFHAKVQIATQVASNIDKVKNATLISDSKKVGNANQNQSGIFTSDVDKTKSVICNSSKTDKVKHTNVASGNKMVGNLIQNQTVIAEIYIKP